MIFKIESYNYWYWENKTYNESIKPFVNDLLQTNSVGRIGYIPSLATVFTKASFHTYFSKASNLKKPYEDPHINNYTNYPLLGPLEFSLASHILNAESDIDITVLTGALGSGKTSLTMYTLNFLKKAALPATDILYFPKNGVIYCIDFNDITDQDKTEEVTIEFKKILINKIVALIEEIHSEYFFIDSFAKAIKERKDARLLEFSEFARKLYRQSNLITEHSRFDFLLDWLHEFDDDLSYKLRLISYLLAFIKENKENGKKTDFILAFDNIDRLHDQAQIEILSIIFSFSNKLPGIKIIVPMRITTFGKIKGNGSYSFSIFENYGHQPIYILKLRIEHFINNVDEYLLLSDRPKEFKAQVLSKIDYVYKDLILQGATSRFYSFYNAISGDSIRRGLYLAERLFLNSVILYSEDKLLQDEFLKALLVSDSPVGKMTNDDRLVCNVFAGDKSKSSMLNIRILQIASFLKENNFQCTISIMLHQISLLGNYSNEEILYSINELLSYPRKLICIDGVKSYSDHVNLSQSLNDVIQITHSGEGYLSALTYSTVYLQNTFIILQWGLTNSVKNFNYLRMYVEKINLRTTNPTTIYLASLIASRKPSITDFLNEIYDFGHVNNRMKLIRECLYVLMLVDLDELAKYYDNNIDDIDFMDTIYIKSSIVIDIIAKISINVFFILKSNFINSEEMSSWYNFLLLTELWQKSFFNTKHTALENSINFYKRELAS